MDTLTVPWAQLPDEPTLWYDRFERYRLMPVADRSVLAVYKAERAASGGQKRTKADNPVKVPGSWDSTALRFNWTTRAAAWDQHEAERRRIEYEQEREEDRKARIALRLKFRTKLEAIIDGLDPNMISQRANVKDLALAVRMLGDEGRADYDDLPTQKIDHAVTDEPRMPRIREIVVELHERPMDD